MPSRIVREGILDSGPVNALSDDAEIFYRRLMSITDDAGRFDDKPELIRARCFPLKLEQWPLDRVTKCLSEVSTPRTVDGHVSDSGQPLVTRYSVNGRKYLQINNFGQRLRVSKFPGPDEFGAKIEQCPSYDGHLTVTCQHQSESESESEALKKELPTGVPKKPPIKPPEPVRHAFGEFGKVQLSQVEHESLVEKLGHELTATYIEAVDGWVAERPNESKRKNRDFKATILNWHRRDEAEGRTRKPKQVGGDVRTKTEAIRDADREAIINGARRHLAKRGLDSAGLGQVPRQISAVREDHD